MKKRIKQSNIDGYILSKQNVSMEADKKTKRIRFPFRKPKSEKISEDILSSGSIDIVDILAPSSADLTHKDYIEADGVYHSYLYITGYGYSTTVGAGWLGPLVEAGDGVNISFHIRKQPRERILSKISQTTMVNRSRMRDVGDTRQDYEELDSAISSGLYLKDTMNRFNEDFYYIHTLIEVTADGPEQLERRVERVQNLCISQDILCKRADYLHEQGFTSTLPVLTLNPDLERKSRRNALTRSVAAAFPFSSYEICDQNGILIGINQHNRSLCMVDIFDTKKYPNSGMMICGMSGSGKTYLLQLIALRYREQGVKTFVIAPLKGYEFRPACEAIGGSFIKLSPSSPDCINIMAIRRMSLDIGMAGSARNDSLLADKIQKLHIFFKLLRPTITDEESQHLDDALLRCYADFGITTDNETVFRGDGSVKTMPTLLDLHTVLERDDKTSALALALSRLVKGSAKTLGGQTNVSLDNDYTVIDISEIGKDLLPLGMFLALDYCWDKCKESRTQKKILMLDELWCLIGASSNRLAADYVLEIFKIARGLGCAPIAATQDLNDFFALDDGKYGRGIINNSRIKVILPLEEEELSRVQETFGLTDSEASQVSRNRRGECLFGAGKVRISVAIHSTRQEHELVTTDRAELEELAGR